MSFRAPPTGRPGLPGAGRYIYSRMGNPTVNALKKRRGLEGGLPAKPPQPAWPPWSSLRASQPGDHVVSTTASTGSSRVMLEKELSRFGVRSTFSTAPTRQRRKGPRPETKMIFIESPMTPAEKKPIFRGGEIAARLKILSSWTIVRLPYLQRPLELGGGHRQQQPDKDSERPHRRVAEDLSPETRKILEA